VEWVYVNQLSKLFEWERVTVKQNDKMVRNSGGLNRLRRCLVFGLVAGGLVSLQGCIFVPILDGFNQSGVTSGQRAAKLAKTVKEFQDYVFWGDVDKALAMAEPEHRKEIGKSLQKLPKDERVVETKMLSADYSEDVYDADVVVQTKSFDKRTLAVHERNIAQKWVFYMGSGWVIKELNEVPQVG
jgi:hypothetical protein